MSLLKVKEYESSEDLDRLVRLRMILMPEVGTNLDATNYIKTIVD